MIHFVQLLPLLSVWYRCHAYPQIDPNNFILFASSAISSPTSDFECFVVTICALTDTKEHSLKPLVAAIYLLVTTKQVGYSA